MTHRPDHIARLPAGILLAVLAIALYLPTLRYEFVFDDSSYITANDEVKDGLTPQALRWAFTTTHAGHRHPLTWISHEMDVELYGLEPTGHHLTNLLLHAANVVLLFLLFDTWTGHRARSVVLAALFAVHPLHVETVAWVADRKDLLVAFWSLATLAAWTRFARGGGRKAYLLALGVFTLALLSKAMAVTVPVLLLLLDVWPLGRRSGRGPTDLRLLVEKVPFFLLAGWAAVLGGRAVTDPGGAHTASPWPLGALIGNAPLQYVSYIGKTFWPRHLAVMYPYDPHPSIARALAAGVLLALLTAAAFRLRHRAPYVLWGWLFFLVSLLPVVGLVPGGPTAMGDRYMYLAITGLLLPAVWGVADLVAAKGRLAHRALPALAAGVGVILAALSVVQCRTWRDDEALYARALEVNRRNPFTHLSMAAVAEANGRAEEALSLYREALEVDPTFLEGRLNLGALLASLGRYEEAVAEYHLALDAHPRSAETRYNLARSLARLQREDEAIAEYREVVRLDPDFGPAHNNLGAMLMRRGEIEAAIVEYREAVRTMPDSDVAQENLRRALARRGD